MQCPISRGGNDETSQHREPNDHKQQGSLQDSTDNMHAGYVYKRRKLRNSVALLSEDNDMGSMKRGSGCNSSSNSECISLEKYNHHVRGIPALPLNTSMSVQCDHNKPVDVLASQTDDTRDLVLPPNCAGEGQEHPMDNVQKLALEYNSATDSFSSSKSNMQQDPPLTKTEVVVVEECSFSSRLIKQPSGDNVPDKDVCNTPLISHGQPGYYPPSNGCTSVDDLVGSDATFCLSCKLCGLKDSPLRMLICDLCEEAFHLSCCRLKKLPGDEWYCQPCLRKKPKLLPETLSGKLFYITSEKQRKRELREKLGPILYMLEDTSPYTSGVRIGKDFQAEVPEWSGPIIDDDDYFSEPLELDPSECYSMNGWSLNWSSRPSSIGNWLQCRGMIYNETDERDEGVLCGKWRRVPLFVSQTEDWDCSCAVRWDPIHADCAVPQELDTSEVLKQLKYIELLKPRLAHKK